MIRRLAPAILLVALSACEPEPAEPAVEAISPARAEALYLKKCAICHGQDGDGLGPRHRSLFVKPPDFRQPGWRRGLSLAQIRAVIREGRPGTDMPAWKGLDDAQVAGLARYVVGFARGS